MRNTFYNTTRYKITSLVVFVLLLLVQTSNAAGVVGSQGLMGPAGIQGLKGAKGDKGEKGDKGATGARGPAGLPQAGNNVGDMQYWDGTQWLIIPLGPVNATLRNCNGAPIWVVSSCPYHIGDTGPAGGKVFYLSDNTGLHGLEAAPADLLDSNSLSYFDWGCYVNGSYIFVSGAQGTAVGTGATNTAAILAACGEANTAAKIADAYTLNGYSDWFLPSKDELNFLYAQKDVVGGFARNLYWSSTDYVANHAWIQSFGYGGQANYYKGSPLPVRAVRAF